MSLPTQGQAYSFLEPLRGRSVTILVGDRQTNVIVSHFVLGCLAVLRTQVTLFDTSSFYGVNIGAITKGLPSDFLQRSTLLLPLLTDDDSNRENKSIATMLTVESPALMIDDLNAFLHVLSSRGQKSGLLRLSTLYHVLSYNARLNNLFCLGTVYRSRLGSVATRSSAHSLFQVGDLQVTVEERQDGVAFRCDKVIEWPPDGFRVSSVHFDDRT